ncbi:GDSL-type esterase/lipase family protein [Streptomyces sp. NPDC058685]|uniref:GDSL-type esterase/lipase family protein n=1 Tax=Streptomyces sp. NPDC058685 TaxID=3346598 RepID=UPI003646EC53
MTASPAGALADASQADPSVAAPEPTAATPHPAATPHRTAAAADLTAAGRTAIVAGAEVYPVPDLVPATELPGSGVIVRPAPLVSPAPLAPARPLAAVPGPESGPPSAPPRALRFAALGDSLTEGVGDRVDDGWRGWAALLAAGLGDRSAPAEFRNFAVSGALTEDVAERQAPEALAFRPDIASVLVGVNDTLRRTFDIEELTRRLDSVFDRLTARGTVLLTACLPDPGTMLGLPLPLARPLARRQRAVNAVVHALSARYDAVHLHASDGAWVLDRSMWSADRLHPGERGHRMIALRFHELLGGYGLARGQAPGAEPTRPPPTRAASLLWLATAGTGWVARRCTDLLPQLMRLAGSEVRHWARGTSERLDRSAEHALSAALAAVSLEVPLARMGE